MKQSCNHIKEEYKSGKSIPLDSCDIKKYYRFSDKDAKGLPSQH